MSPIPSAPPILRAPDPGGTAAQTGMQPLPAVPPPARRRTSFHGRRLVLLVIALVLIAALFGAYNAAAAWTYSSAESAHERLDCATASPKFGQVMGFYSWALTTSEESASRAERECAFVLDAENLAEDEEHEEAADAYANAIEANPASTNFEQLDLMRASQVLAWSAELVARAIKWEDGTYVVRAMNNYVDLMDDFGSYEEPYLRAAKRIDGIDARVSQTIKSRPCVGLRYAEALEGEYYGYGDELARALYGCAGEKFAAGRFTQAQRLYDRIVDEAPRNKLVPAARRRSIASEVAAIRGKGTGKLPAPVVSGSSGSNNVKLTIRNSSPYGLEYLISGPHARRITLPACGGCKKYTRGQEPARCPPGPSRTITVRAGSYTEVVRSLSGNVTDWSGDQDLSAGDAYSHCFFIVTSRP